MTQHKRAARRHHRNRIKDKRSKQFKYLTIGLSEKEIIARLPKSINTPKPCSCFICGNPRKYCNEKTTQEKKLSFANSIQLYY